MRLKDCRADKAARFDTILQFWACFSLSISKTSSTNIESMSTNMFKISRLGFTVIFTSVFATNAHLYIKDPHPLAGNNVKDPIEASGFPCHGFNVSIVSSRTVMKVGEAQPLNFELGNGQNTDVHGGGSCQISVSYETNTAKLKDPANWKVIKSFIGGCPTDYTSNLPVEAKLCSATVPYPACVNNLQFTIPPEVQSGDAILAWTWFNNVGIREIYMNCAAVNFEGGSDRLDLLPNMFVANLDGIGSCSTTENYNTDFPEPGNYVQKESPPNFPFLAPSCRSRVTGTATRTATPSLQALTASQTGRPHNRLRPAA